FSRWLGDGYKCKGHNIFAHGGVIHHGKQEQEQYRPDQSAHHHEVALKINVSFRKNDYICRM
ncbi:MAG: hypothetical protein K2J51_03055, partial [Alistipes sp.]|nr:hypothetical protein [Alistipes sp.]